MVPEINENQTRLELVNFDIKVIGHNANVTFKTHIMVKNASKYKC